MCFKSLTLSIMVYIPYFALLSFADVVLGSTFYKLVNTSENTLHKQEQTINERKGIPHTGACALMAYRDRAPSFSYGVSSQLCVTLKQSLYTSTDNSTLDFTKEFLNYDSNESLPKGESTNEEQRSYKSQLFTELKTWAEAGRRCQAVGGNLVDITSAEEQILIEEFLHTNNAEDENYWIGANDIDKEDNFVWSVNNQRVSYNHWNLDEPNNYNDQDCVSLETQPTGGRRWSDKDCDKEYAFVCKV